MAAGIALGGIRVDEWRLPADLVEPREGPSQRYQQLYEHYLQLEDSCRALSQG